MSILAYTSRNITGAFSQGLICNMNILERESAVIDLLASKKTNRVKEHLEHVARIKISNLINLYNDYYLNIARNMSDWMEVYNSIDVTPLSKYEGLYIFGGLHFSQSNISRFSKRSNVFPKDRNQLKFVQTGSHIINVLAIHKAHVEYDIPLHEFSYDSDELCTGMFQLKQNPSKYNLYHIYDIPKYGMKRLDSLQYFLSKRNKSIIPLDKIYDFTFGYTVYANGNRAVYAKYVEEIAKNFKVTNLYVKNTITGVSNVIDRETYMNKISQSKYTFILPSYDNECFSMYRFIESIDADCLPLIHKDVFVDDAELSFNVDLNQLKTDVIFSDEKRIELLNYYKNIFLVFKEGFIK